MFESLGFEKQERCHVIQLCWTYLCSVVLQYGRRCIGTRTFWCVTKLIVLFLNENICCGYLKELSQLSDHFIVIFLKFLCKSVSL